jgi:SAM-dependent methyltransferase
MAPSLEERLEAVRSILRTYEQNPFSREVDPRDDMTHPDWDKEFASYFLSGRTALELVLDAMITSGVSAPATILDMPSGFGRVTRHLVSAFPAARIYACDLYQDRIDFCASAFKVRAFKSKEDFDQLTFPEKFDVIWCGSLLTHLPARLFRRCIASFSRSLNPGGIAVVSLQGRHSPYIQKHKWKYIDDARFAKAEARFRSEGFGYVDYNLKAQFFEQDAYGVTLSSPAWVMRSLEDDESIRITGFLERAWDECQDVAVFKKTPIHA